MLLFRVRYRTSGLVGCQKHCPTKPGIRPSGKFRLLLRRTQFFVTSLEGSVCPRYGEKGTRRGRNRRIVLFVHKNHVFYCWLDYLFTHLLASKHLKCLPSFCHRSGNQSDIISAAHEETQWKTTLVVVSKIIMKKTGRGRQKRRKEQMSDDVKKNYYTRLNAQSRHTLQNKNYKGEQRKFTLAQACKNEKNTR